MSRSRWTTLAVSALVHGAVLLVAVLTVAYPVVSSSGGATVVLDVTPPPEATSLPVEDDALAEPVWPEEVDVRPRAPTLPEAGRPKTPPEVEEELPPLEDEIEALELEEIAVRVAWLPSKRPAPRSPVPRQPPPSPRVRQPTPPTRPAPARKPAALVPVRAPRHYPAEAWRLRLEGRARVAIEVDAGGRVTAARLVQSTGHPVLDRAAVESARQWRFRPPGEIRRAVIPFRYDLP